MEEYYRVLHSIPEIGFELDKTRAYVRKTLESFGCEVCDVGGGLVTDIGKGSKTILLRADMDALPFKDGAKHACGHDLHTSMLLGAAKILKQKENGLCGRVRLMFQPAEEILQGAERMIENGVLEGVDCAVMMHVVSAVPFRTGTVILPSEKTSTAAADFFKVTIKGKACHSSAPWEGIDTVNVCSHISLCLQNLASKETPASSGAVLTLGSIHGGTAANIVADSAEMHGSLRSRDDTVQTRLKQRVSEICDHISKAYRAGTEVDFYSGCPTFKNNKELCKCISKYVTGLLGNECTLSADDLRSGGGSEDFSNVSNRIPAAMLVIAAGNVNDGYTYPQHHPNIKFDTSVFEKGTAVYVEIAKRWLEEHSV